MNAEQLRQRSSERRRALMDEFSALPEQTHTASYQPLLLEIACAVHQWGAEQAAILAEMRDTGRTTPDLSQLKGELRCKQCNQTMPVTVETLREFLALALTCDGPMCDPGTIEWTPATDRAA